jgi:hypothetical protein
MLSIMLTRIFRLTVDHLLKNFVKFGNQADKVKHSIFK